MNLPFCLEAWFPLIGSPLKRVQTMGVDSPADSQELRQAWGACESGEALVVVDGIRGSLGKGLLRRCGRTSKAKLWARELASQGRVYRWRVFPGTGGTHILLCAERGGLEAGLPLLPAGRRRWRLVRFALKCLDRLGLADFCGFSEVLVALKGEGGVPQCPWIERVPGALVGISLGVEGPLRKATLRVCQADRTVSGYLKLSLGKASRACVSNEADALERIQRTKLPADIAPRLLDRGQTSSCVWFVQSPLKGARSLDHLTATHLELLTSLSTATASLVPFAELTSHRGALQHLEDLRETVDASWSSAMETLAEGLERELGGRDIPCGLAHGDFTPWNLAAGEDRLAAFDWEFSSWDAPLLSDFVHFHVQTGILVRRVAAETLLDELEAMLNGEAEFMLRDRDLDGADALALIGLEVLRAATFDEFQNSIQMPPFAQVQWLRAARLELAIRIGERLLARNAPHEQEALAA